VHVLVTVMVEPENEEVEFLWKRFVSVYSGTNLSKLLCLLCVCMQKQSRYFVVCRKASVFLIKQKVGMLFVCNMNLVDFCNS